MTWSGIFDLLGVYPSTKLRAQAEPDTMPSRLSWLKAGGAGLGHIVNYTRGFPVSQFMALQSRQRRTVATVHVSRRGTIGEEKNPCR